ncbi:MAG TPA: O-antigen ligase family protein [Bradyrhizobium sp.]|nr:O-antigen ligase family protein [Bradyrhizobium sp.]
MKLAAREPLGALLSRRWHDPAAWIATTDVFFILLALALPWSTSLTAIFAVAALVTMAPFFDANGFLRAVKRPASIFPLALFTLALVGMLWSDAPWDARLHAAGPAAKLLMVPLLFYHFERSTRGVEVFKAFLLSCVLLMAMSWLVAYDPRLTLNPIAGHGVPVKNYIDQSQEFALCAVVLAYPLLSLSRAGRILPAMLLGAIAIGFVANMMFVVVSRTALVTMPIMLAVFGMMHLRWRANAVILVAAIALAGLARTVSPQLQQKVNSFDLEYRLYKEQRASTSVGQRLEFYRKSVRFFAESPIIGHGSGSIRGLFERAVEGPAGLAAAEVIGNPHNQTLNVAIQWGALGIFTLYAMWISHVMWFRGGGPMAWVGLMVVVQNFFTSLFNSHIFDFTEGWIYVLGVGIAGGMILKANADEKPASSSAS